MHQGPDTLIFRLYDEILCYIFDLNADMDLEADSGYSHEQVPWNIRPLNVTRYTSQVCRHWRDLLLRSPSIWGKVIDLYLLGQEEGLWGKEIMRRTGESSLCVKGLVTDTEPTGGFFVDLLKNHWSRIRRLDVTVYYHETIDSKTWDVLRSPAPLLEFFKIELEDWNDFKIFSTTEASLFSDHAPSLREFHFSSHPDVFVNRTLQVPWLRRLQKVTLGSTFSSRDILDALGDMPFLEFLELQQMGKIDDTLGSHLPGSISLPRLSTIRLIDCVQLRTPLSILECIVPLPGCALVLNTDNRMNTDAGDINAYQKIIPNYAAAFFNSRVDISVLTLGLDFRLFYFNVPHQGLDPSRNSRPSYFSIDILTSSTFPPGSLSAFLTAFFPCRFNNITTFELLDGPRLLDLDQEIASLQTSFVSLLSSVETLQVSGEPALQDIIKVLEENPGFFPLLHTLKLRPSELSTYPITSSFQHTLLSFLDRRIGDGLPVKVFDVTDAESWDWGFLERVTGLQVTRINADVAEDYICGSGKPENLNFRITVAI